MNNNHGYFNIKRIHDGKIAILKLSKYKFYFPNPMKDISSLTPYSFIRYAPQHVQKL